MAGPADGDWISHPAGTSDLSPATPTRVLACGSFRAGVDPTIAADYRASLDALSDAGLAVAEVASPADPGTLFDWFVMASAELATTLLDVRDHWETFDDSLRDMLIFGSGVSLEDYLSAQRRRHELGARIRRPGRPRLGPGPPDAQRPELVARGSGAGLVRRHHRRSHHRHQHP